MRQSLGSIALTSVLLVGCGGGGLATYPVEGQVTFPDGKPLHGGIVQFQPVGEQSGKINSRGRIQEDGSFRMSTFESEDGSIEGEHRVLVVPPSPPGPADPWKLPKPVIHERFRSYETSGLTYTVTPDGPNEFKFTVDPP